MGGAGVTVTATTVKRRGVLGETHITREANSKTETQEKGGD